MGGVKIGIGPASIGSGVRPAEGGAYIDVAIWHSVERDRALDEIIDAVGPEHLSSRRAPFRGSFQASSIRLVK